jgi:hypothetical protein
MKMANFEVIDSVHNYILLRDLGPWDEYPTITNAAEEVVEEMIKRLIPDTGFINADGKQRRLFYIDSDNDYTELVIKDGKFSHFAPASQRLLIQLDIK